MATRREIATRLAILTAAEKAVKAAKEKARSEARAMMREAYAEDGITSLDMLVGDVKVGRIGNYKPTVGISGGDAFDRWAYENGMASRSLVIDAGTASDEMIQRVSELLEGSGISYRFKYAADPEAKKQVRVVGDHVLDDNGEIVPGAFVRMQDIRVTGCKPEDVGAAMAQMGDGTTLAGFLGGGE